MAKKSFLEQIAKDSGKSAVIDTVLGTTPEAELKTAKQIKTQPEKVQKATYTTGKENRSKRVQVLMKPSLYAKIEREAAKVGHRKVNEVINAILEQALENED